MYLKFNTQLQPQKRKKWIKQKCIVFQVVLSRYSMLNIFWQDHFKPCFFLVKRCFYFKMLFCQWVFTLSLKLILLRSFNLYFSFWLHKKCPYLGLFWSAFFQHFPHLDWIRRDTEYLSIFSPDTGGCSKNADQNNYEYGLFLRSVSVSLNLDIRRYYSNPVTSIIATKFIWIKFHHLITGLLVKLSISCQKFFWFTNNNS